MSFGPVADGDRTVSNNPRQAREEKRIADVPILIGSNAQEYRIFLAAATGGRTTIDMNAFLTATFPGNTDMQQKLRDAYPVGQGKEFATDFDAASQIATDMGFTCPAGLEANISAKAGFKTWRYMFNASFPNTQPFEGAGVFHSSEIPLVFGNLPMNSSTPAPTEQEMQLSKMMQKAWADFAKNPSDGPGWSAVGSDDAMVGVLGGPKNDTGVEETQMNVVDKRCALFAQATTTSEGGRPPKSTTTGPAQFTGAAATHYAPGGALAAALAVAALL